MLRILELRWLSHYFRCFYNVPYADEIEAWANGRKVFEETFERKAQSRKELSQSLRRAIRYEYSCDRLIAEHSVKKVLSIASGMEQRGIVLVNKYPLLDYIETDISDHFAKKVSLLDSIFKENNLKNRSHMHSCIADASVTLSNLVQRLLSFLVRDRLS